MARLIFILSFFGFITYLKCELFNYKTLGEDHTMCKPLQKSGCKIISTGMIESERDEILKKHNELREKVALGNQSPQPKAADMGELVWDNELAMIAQRWTNQCDYEHDANRRSKKYGSVGQNLASLYAGDSRPTLSKAVQDWYDEVIKPGLAAGQVSKFTDNPPEGDGMIGHYTQVVWAKTTAVGCGTTVYEETDGHIWATICCNYAPAGNYMDGKIYEEGDPCSRCEEKCADGWTGLCYNPKKNDPLEDVSALSKTTCGKYDGGDDDDRSGGVPRPTAPPSKQSGQAGRAGRRAGKNADHFNNSTVTNAFDVKKASNFFLIIGLLCINILTCMFGY